MTTNHHEIMRLINDVEHSAPFSYRHALHMIEHFAQHWGGRWIMFRVEIGGTVYWPVLNEYRAGIIRDHAGWDLVTTREGKGVDE